jgi:hypothetical protein
VNLVNRIHAFAKLGDILRNPDPAYHRNFAAGIRRMNELIEGSKHDNGFFTPENVKFAFQSIGKSLKIRNIERWLKKYNLRIFERCKPKTIGVVMAGNIPMVGFHDYLSVLISGHKLLAKLSSSDSKLLPLLHHILVKAEPDFADRVTFTDDALIGFDAIIATGSDNTSRYFDYYFGKYPNIIRRNRISVAVITGRESDEELNALGEDIFRYYGLGCRNVSKLFVPKNYKFDRFYENIKDWVEVINNVKYKNNYDYNKAIFLVNKTPYLDNGFLMLRRETAVSSPMSVVYHEEYTNLKSLKQLLKKNNHKLQCVVSIDKSVWENGVVAPGKTQHPELWDYADGLDTLAFLTALK